MGGGPNYLNLDDIRANVRYLIQNHHLKILDLRELHPSVNIEFQRFTNFVAEVSNSDIYNDVFNIVEEESKHIEQIAIGTIGAYFRGCLVSTSFPGNPSCSSVCIDSFQPPSNQEGWLKCDKTVIDAIWDAEKNNYTFEIVHKGDSVGYIQLNTTDFKGFSNSEKAELKKHIFTCKILNKSQEGRYYKDLLSGFYTLDELPSRVENSSIFNAMSHPFAMVSIVILILIIGYFLYRMNSSKE